MMVAARILGLRIVDLPIPTRYAGEVSHLRPIPYGIAVLRLMARYLRGDYHRLIAGQGPAATGPAPSPGFVTDQARTGCRRR